MPDHPQEQDILEQEKKAVEEIIAIKPITAENAAFTRTQGGFLQLVYAGKTYPRVAVHRCFPFSDPDHYISIREPETDGREIGLIIDLKALPKEVQIPDGMTDTEEISDYLSNLTGFCHRGLELKET